MESKPTRYISHTDTNVLIRATLKREFPGVKFSVRCGSGSSTATYITWTDGPAAAAVEKATSNYVGSTPDHGGDYWDTRVTTDETGERVSYGSNHIFTRRNLSKKFTEPAAELTAKLLGVDTVQDINYTHEDGTNLHAVTEFTGRHYSGGFAWGSSLIEHVAGRLAECDYLGVDAEAELEKRRRQADLEAATFQAVRQAGGTFEQAHEAVRALTDPKAVQVEKERAAEYAQEQVGIAVPADEYAAAEALADEESAADRWVRERREAIEQTASAEVVTDTARELLDGFLAEVDPRYLGAFSLTDLNPNNPRTPPNH